MTRAPGLKIATQERREGGPGGRNAGTRAPEESEHALQTTRAHNEPYARYNWREWGRRFYGADLKATNQEQRPQRPRPARERKPFKFAGAGDTCFTRRANKALLRGCRLELLRGAARKLAQMRKPGATQAQPTHATPGDAREKRPTRFGLYHDLRGVHTILDTLATPRIFLYTLKPLYYKGFRPFSGFFV